MVKKMLNSLPKSWEPKVTVIEESKDLNLLSLDKFICSLLTYEMKIDHNAYNDDEEEEMTMFAKKFKKFMKFNKAKSSPRRDVIKGKKAMMTTWSDSDSSDSDKDNEYTFEELQDAFDELAIDFETMESK
ncbi:hypothetical protein Gohar_016851 [Gossypium harknessii]|uniref:UBN2 domain-containing protein n=1 Tax=Gossypium harknessii TaxID=34285 RepID=A0A7J9G499_9ROSI|nr:hypothetical protein [Gossypium harknessii]